LKFSNFAFFIIMCVEQRCVRMCMLSAAAAAAAAAAAVCVCVCIALIDFSSCVYGIHQ
jgi:hypothetical protein